MKGVIIVASFQKYKTKQGTLWLFKTYVGIDPKTGKRKPTTRRGFKTKKKRRKLLGFWKTKSSLEFITETILLLNRCLMSGGPHIKTQ